MTKYGFRIFSIFLLYAVTDKNNVMYIIYRYFYVNLQKIGCTSAIETSFIALGLHYLCRR